MIINNKVKKKTYLLLGAGERGGEGRESVREGKVASTCVVCRDAKMPLPNIISGPLSAWLQMPRWLSWLQPLSYA